MSISIIEDKPKLVLGAEEWQAAPFRFLDNLQVFNDTASWQDIVLSGDTALTLTNALTNSLNYLKLFGGCEQSETPTPENLIDIVCNNGAIKYSINEANYVSENVVLGYWIRNNNGQPEASPANFYTNLMPIKPNTSYVCYGRSKANNTVSGYNRIAWYDANGTWLRNSTYTQGTIGQDVSPSVGAFARFHCNINGTEVTQELVDSYNWTFCEGSVEVPYAPYSPNGIYTDGTVETVEVDTTSDTATAEMLLKVGDYQDVQNVTNGHITRNVGIKVLDGTENWQLATATDLVQFYTASTQGVIKNNVSLMSTIAPYGCTVANRTQYNFGCYSGNSGNLCFQMKGSATLTTVNAWTSFLATQYNAGTPIIVAYPLATPTTETVEHQHLSIQTGTNIVEIVQASIDNLELEVSYKATI